ncbi:putative dynein heavy chain [Toxoplasma gondii FOU]|uniref:Putative dynein heavy chain n=1 Tax=Toxoplasma gondii FOU TaxID=943167 RepID=A0A086KKK2_TOXGO|nr:putative dynein heavy chain [Toxoplasma gondii FOU]
MVWTTDCHEALEKLSRERDKSIMNATNKKFVAMMTDLVAACLSDLGTQLNRTKYETLVTIHVHQRDVFADLWKKVKEHRLRDSSDFEWLKQTRLYWKTDTDNALIAIADVDFTYSYEYLGVKERLAITPLTDRQEKQEKQIEKPLPSVPLSTFLPPSREEMTACNDAWPLTERRRTETAAYHMLHNPCFSNTVDSSPVCRFSFLCAPLGSPPSTSARFLGGSASLPVFAWSPLPRSPWPPRSWRAASPAYAPSWVPGVT